MRKIIKIIRENTGEIIYIPAYSFDDACKRISEEGFKSTDETFTIWYNWRALKAEILDWN